jgi:hypothetical protein
MLNGDETGDQTQNLGGASLRLEQDIFVRNELFRRSRDRASPDDRDLRDFQLGNVRIVGEGRGDNEQQRGKMEE